MDALMKKDDIIAIARKRMDEAAASDIDNRDRAQDDLRYLIGDQWPEEARTEREGEGKPCLTINRLPQFVRQVTGQIRQMNPAIRVVPSDNVATEDVAEIFAGLIKQIEYKSDAQTIYEGGAESAAACSIGHWRVRADYMDGMTFDQECLIERIHNPFSVFWDPLAKHPTRRDARYCFITEDVAKEDFREQYPGADLSDVTSENQMDAIRQWITAETVTVAEYFWVEHKEQEIGQLRDGTVVEKIIEGMDIVRRRKVRMPQVKWAKITFNEVLEGPTDVPCSYIPVVAVTGEEWHLGEELYRSSVIRFAKDPQQLYNFARSTQAEVMTLQPKAPYMVTTKQINGLETFWNEANTRNRPYLPYHPDPQSPPPMRVAPPVASQAVAMEVQMSAEDMKGTTGIYDASLGATSNEKSGVAIRERKMEAQTNTSVYADNMVKAITQTGKILVSMIPKVYDTQRVIRILGEDDQEKQVLINSLMVANGQYVPVNDLTMGSYDVRISVGPSYETKRQEASEGMMAFLQAVPQAAPMVADLIAKMQDWPESDRVAERLRKALPPGLAEEEEQQSPEAMQAAQMAQQQQAQAMQQQQAAMQMEMAKAEAEIRKAQAEAKEAEADAIKAQVEAQLAVAQMNVGILPRAPMGATNPQGF
jgi:hypothetical protein